MTQLTAITNFIGFFFLKGRLVVVDGERVVGVCEHEALFTAEMLVPSAHVPFCT